jgi:hypothetical protein
MTKLSVPRWTCWSNRLTKSHSRTHTKEWYQQQGDLKWQLLQPLLRQKRVCSGVLRPNLKAAAMVLSYHHDLHSKPNRLKPAEIFHVGSAEGATANSAILLLQVPLLRQKRQTTPTPTDKSARTVGSLAT